MTVPVARADELNSVQILPFKYPVGEFFAAFLDNYGTPPAGGDPLPLGAQADGDVVGFEVVQNVKRFSKYFIVCVIVPAAIMTVLSLITFIIPPSMVTQRVALNLSIILSLTALQFVVANSLPKLSEPTAINILFLLNYCTPAFAVFESLAVYTVLLKKESVLSERESSGAGSPAASPRLPLPDSTGDSGRSTAVKPDGGGKKKVASVSWSWRSPSARAAAASVALIVPERLKPVKPKSKTAFIIDKASLVTCVLVIVISYCILLTPEVSKLYCGCTVPEDLQPTNTTRA